MILQGMEGVEFIVVNTDARLAAFQGCTKFRFGSDGLGAGGDPDKGRECALEDRERLPELVEGCDTVFIAAGMGGGTGLSSTNRRSNQKNAER